jgi:4-methoxybenzoate monooxygenase (O-demethylating)
MVLTGASATRPPGVPIVEIDPFDEGFLADPYPLQHTLRQAGPLFWLPSIQVYGMARHAEVSAALKDWQTYISSRGVGLLDFAKNKPWRAPSLLLETDPPVHTAMRALMNQVVSLRSLKSLQPTWRREADSLVDELVGRKKIDAVTELAEVYPLRVFPDTIGLPLEGRQHLLPYAAAVFNAYGPDNAVSRSTAAELPEASAWVNRVCLRESLAPTGWGMDIYRLADQGLCTQEEAQRLVRSFLSAGVDTTVNGIANMMLAFAQYPEQWARLRADRTLKKRAFEESLRWDSTVQIFFRTTSRDLSVAELPIPQGSKVLLFLSAANRDPRRWNDPDVFDITRAASGHVGFGYGIHQCLGQMVARQEAELVLDALLERVAEIRPAGRAVRRLNNSLHSLASVPIEIVPA